MVTIRPMLETDADAVRWVSAAGFSAWWKRMTGEMVELPRRTRDNVLACWEKDPEGCFVAEDDGGVVGIIFSRTWGRVGWFGTFAVLPEYQGCGIGKRLIRASLDYLRRDPGRVIGLETMPDSPYNLGLYARQGFQPRLPTFLLSKVLVGRAESSPRLRCWASVEPKVQEHWLTDLRMATNRIRSGLDYSKEIRSAARRDLGETLVLEDDGRAVGLATVWLTGIRERGDEESGQVQVLALHPAHTAERTLRVLLEATEGLARARGKQRLTVWVNGQHTWALERVLGWGYRIERAMLRMVLEGTDRGPRANGHVDLSRWAG